MRNTIYILMGLLTVSLAHAQSKLMRGSTAIVLPSKLMQPERKGHLAEYEDLYLRETEGRSRITNQYMHYDAQTLMKSPDSVFFGFRENQNDKKVKIVVNLATQTATLNGPGIKDKEMRVSTGSPQFSTAKFVGCYEVKHTNKLHLSKQYNNAPMPNSTFFISTAGIAIHTGNLHSHSHGCVRMADEDSKFVMNLVNKYSRVVEDPTGRRKRVFDAEICVENAAPLVAQNKPATRRVVKPKPATPPPVAIVPERPWYQSLIAR